jgi:hypothetical protein
MTGLYQARWEGWRDNNKTDTAMSGVGARAARMNVCRVIVLEQRRGRNYCSPSFLSLCK